MTPIIVRLAQEGRLPTKVFVGDTTDTEDAEQVASEDAGEETLALDATLDDAEIAEMWQAVFSKYDRLRTENREALANWNEMLAELEGDL